MDGNFEQVENWNREFMSLFFVRSGMRKLREGAIEQPE
jgi:hypothetical protein